MGVGFLPSRLRTWRAEDNLREPNREPGELVSATFVNRKRKHSSWSEIACTLMIKIAMVKKMMRMEGVILVEADQCMYGLKTWGDRPGKSVPAKKPTNFMTNSVAIGRELKRRCDSSHEHQPLTDGRANAAARSGKWATFLIRLPPIGSPAQTHGIFLPQNGTLRKAFRRRGRLTCCP